MHTTEMSPAAITSDATISGPASPTVPLRTPIQPQQFSTLVRVETRKLTNTRSGKLLVGSALGLALIVLTWKLLHTGSIPVSFENYGEAVGLAVGFILPVVALLAMTSEWTQRTALSTFTMSPRRLHVFSAKFVAAAILSMAVAALVLVLTLGATALGGVISGDGASYEGMVDVIRSVMIITLLQVVMAAAVGALIPQTAVALTVFFTAPTVWGGVAPSVLKDSSDWFDIFLAYDRLSSGHPLDHLPQTLSSVAVWVAVPAAIGLYRSVHREVK